MDFLRNLFKKKLKNLKYGKSMGSDAMTLNFSMELDSNVIGNNCSMWVLKRLDF